jgi:hypothetical protein
MTIRRTGLPHVHFLWRHHVQPHRDPIFTLQFLSRLKNDPIAMHALRNLLLESSRRMAVVRLTDDEVLTVVVQLIGSGELVVGWDWDWLSGGAGGAQQESVPLPAAIVAAPTEPMARIAEPDPPTFPTDHDGARQVGVLVAAASGGEPFCAT